MIAVAVLVAVAALGWVGVFPGPGDVLLLGAIGAGAVGATAVLARRGVQPGLRALVLLAGVVVAATASAERRPPGPGTLGDVTRGLRDGWAQILDSHLPVDPRGGPMATATVLAGLAGCLAGAAHLAGRPMLRLVPPLALLTTGLGFGAAGSPPPAITSAAVVGAAAVVLLMDPVRRLQHIDRRALMRSASMGGAVVAVVLVVGNAWPGATARDRYDPRQLRRQPLVVSPVDNPLTQLGAALADEENPELFRAEVHGAPPERWRAWRLVVLDHFDGDGWTASPTFRRVGAELPPPDLGVPTLRVEQTITPIDLDGPFLPAVDAPVKVDDDRVVADDGGVLALPDDVEHPESYRVVSAVPALDPSRIEAAAPARGRQPPLDPASRTQFQAIIDQARAGANPSAAGTLKSLEQWFVQQLRQANLDGDAPPPTGNGVHHINRLFEQRVGTAEQFASAFAVLARMQGYDARVVVGFRPGEPDPARGELVVHAHDMLAWPEVRFEGVGWVAYDPMPASSGDPTGGTSELPAPATAGISPTTAPTTASAGDQADAGGPDGATRDRRASGGWSWIARVAVAVGATLLVLLVAAGGLVGAKAVRRRRQRQGSPGQRVAGAWSAALDRLAEGGARLPRHLTATEVVTAPRVPAAATEALTVLADAANAARFSGFGPNEAAADEAWTAAEAVAAAVRSHRSGLRLALSPAPFLAP